MNEIDAMIETLTHSQRTFRRLKEVVKMKNWMKRAIRTFIQSVVGYLVVALPAIDWHEESTVLRGTLIGLGV